MTNILQSYNGKPLVHSWVYRAMDGAPLGVVGRYQNGSEKKDIVPFFKGNGSAGIDLNPRPLFGLDILANHPKDKAVFIAEGERSAAALQGMGICAVTSLGGSSSASKADWTPLNGYKMAYILPDNDEPGEHYAKDVYEALLALESPPDIRLVRLEGLPDAGDIVDWLMAKVNDWDGFQQFPKVSKKRLLAELKSAINRAQAVPTEWASVSSDWDALGEIETKTPPVQALTTALIPEPFRPWIADASYQMQTPPDFATVSMVVVVASVIGAGCSIKPKKFDDWEVIPNLWGAVIAPPSKKKTPTMSKATGLLDRLQAEYGGLFDKERAGNEFDGLASKAMLDDVKNQLAKLAKGKGEDRTIDKTEHAKLKADYIELSEKADQEPTRRMFKANETSVQSMTVLQGNNPRGILVIRDELTGLLAKWETEAGQEERTYYLTGWNGSGSYTDSKVGRGLTECKQICISLLGGIQPDKLKRYLYQAMNGFNDGLIQRLQLAVWPDIPTGWKYVDKLVNKADESRAYEGSDFQ